MNELINYWPQSEYVEECLRTEAETIDEALLLAVHEPVKLLRRTDQNAKDIISSEQDLLKELMRPARDGSAVIVAITGASGVGKSHMVRWLKAQLERHPRRRDLVIVTIPKTASLRRVVQLILEPLPGEAYEALRKELDQTVEALEPERAATLLGAAIAMELESYEKRLSEDIRSANAPKDMGPRVTLARHLRRIIRDANVLDAWFHKDVLVRIASTSLGGAGNPLARQFCAADLEPPSSVRSEIRSQEVNASLQFLANANGANRAVAAEVLQEVLDPALRTIFGLTQGTHRRTVQELVDDIRRQLLKDNKELVLLIEDLAALSGIQQPLLDIMIAETDEAGQKVRAQIRTAVAVTDGFLAGRQTVLTRARGQWVVQSEGLGETEVVQRLVELTGRYLNACRFGIAKLKEAFGRAEATEDLYAWVPRFEYEGSSLHQLESFGRSASGFALFPFNQDAIRSLAAQALRRGTDWTFNPRNFINEVLRKVLLERSTFQSAQFPPPEYFSPKVPSAVAIELQNQGRAATELGRLESMLYHWSGNPSSLQQEAIPKDLFDAFDLPWPFAATGAPRTKSPRALTTTAKPSNESSANKIAIETSTALSPLNEAPEETAFAKAVEAWDGSTRLKDSHALRIRTLLETALGHRMDLSDLALSAFKAERKHFWLPPELNVSNPGAEQLRVKIAEEGKPVPPHVKAGLKALDKWEVHGRSWGFIDADEAYANASVLLDEVEKKLIHAVLEEAERDASLLMTALHRQSMTAGIQGTAAPEDAPLRQMFSQCPEAPPLQEALMPPNVRPALDDRTKLLEARTHLQELLLANLACFQGNGQKPLAVDPDRVRRAWKRQPSGHSVLSTIPKEKITQQVIDVLDRLSALPNSLALQRMCKAIDAMRASIAEAFDHDYARVAWRDALSTCIESSLHLGLWPSKAIQADVRKSIEQLTTEASEGWIRKALRMPPPMELPSPEERLAAISHLPLPQLVFLQCALSTLTNYLEAQQGLIDHQSKVDGEDALKIRERLLTELDWSE